MMWPFGALRMFGYGVVVIDPPWPWEAYGPNGYDKSPEAQYTTMPFAEIAALPVGQLLGAGGVVICWGTWPLVATQTKIMEGDWFNPQSGQREGWHLKQKTGGAWAKRTLSGKLRWGPGYVLRSVCEPFFICSVGDALPNVRGRDQPNLIETLSDALVDGVAREHSRKPEEFYKLIEAIVSPSAFRADVFGRAQREGWDVYGNEANRFSGGTGDHPANGGTPSCAGDRGGVDAQRNGGERTIPPLLLFAERDQPRDAAGSSRAGDKRAKGKKGKAVRACPGAGR